MRFANEITIKPIPDIENNAAPKCELFAHGVATGHVISGAYLEAAIQWKNGYLLFLTDDIPFEETLRICLLDRHWQLLDSATIGCMYSTGTFADLKLAENNHAQFRFMGDTDWDVEIFDQPRLSFTLLGEPAGVTRKPGFSRHFLLRGQPKHGQ